MARYAIRSTRGEHLSASHTQATRLNVAETLHDAAQRLGYENSSLHVLNDGEILVYVDDYPSAPVLIATPFIPE